jgi:tetratricopeptide (TPR) repeat protein
LQARARQIYQSLTEEQCDVFMYDYFERRRKLDFGNAAQAARTLTQLFALVGDDQQIIRRLGPETLNTIAWNSASRTGTREDIAMKAAELAERAKSMTPENASLWNTLGVCQYRAGELQQAIESLNTSMALHQLHESYDYFFLAMAYAKLGDKAAARQWYDRAVQWTDQNSPTDLALLSFRTEATEVLGLPKASSATGPSAPR